MRISKEKLKNFGFNTLNTVLPVVLALVIGAVGIIVAKKNPLLTYWTLFSKSLLNYNGLMKTLHNAAPLILTGLAIAVSFKAGLFNMGVEGSLLVAGFSTAVLGYKLQNLPSGILIPFLLISAILVGMLVSLVPALLKAYFNVNEMVVTLLLNYAIMEILEYLTSNVFRNPASGYVSTHTIGQNAIFPWLGSTKITAFFFVAIIVFVIMYIVFKHSKLGFEIEAMGKNVLFSEATGMNVRKKVIVIMLLSGAIAGIAGAGWMMSEKYSYTLSFSGNPGLGWDGMLISLLGAHDPVGIIIAAIFYAALKVGSHSIAVFTQVPSEIVSVIQALIILLLSIKFIQKKVTKQKEKYLQEENK
ncbi:MAG TPA: ABC transporter permease [Bacilli bacterium]